MRALLSVIIVGATTIGCSTVQAESLHRAIPIGETRRADFWYALYPDCKNMGDTVVRVTQQPAHGRVTISKALDYTRFGKDNQRYECNRKKSVGTAVAYTPNPGFAGSDRFAVTVIFPHGVEKVADYDIIVK